MLQQKVNEALRLKYEQGLLRERSGLYSPSSFGRCFRAQFWNRKNELKTNPPDERSLRIFAVGNLFHDFVQQFYPDAQKEVEVKTDDCMGYADIVNGDCVYDIKSQHSRAFWYMQKSGYDVNKEKLPNIMQVCFYGKILGKSKGVLVFISKDDLVIQEYAFEVDKFWNVIREEIDTLVGYWSRDLLPPASPRVYGTDKDGSSRECMKYCSYRDKCFKLQGKELPNDDSDNKD
jgi:hypothetical protein